MSLDYSQIMEYRRHLSSELMAVEALLLFDQLDFAEIPEEVVPLILEVILGLKDLPSTGRNAGLYLGTLAQAPLVELCKLYYSEQSLYAISVHFSLSCASVEKIIKFYGLPERPEILDKKQLPAPAEKRNGARYGRFTKKDCTKPELPARSDFVTSVDIRKAPPEKALQMINSILSGERAFIT